METLDCREVSVGSKNTTAVRLSQRAEAKPAVTLMCAIHNRTNSALDMSGIPEGRVKARSDEGILTGRSVKWSAPFKTAWAAGSGSVCSAHSAEVWLVEYR